MPETITQDEIVSERAPSRGTASRPVVNESVDAAGAVKVSRAGVEEEQVGDGPRKGRTFKESTEKLLQKLDKAPALAPHEVGDADEDEPEDDAGGDDDSVDGDETAEAAAADAAGDAAGESDEEDPGEETKPDPVVEWQSKYTTLEQRNRALVSELDAARKTPKAQRTPREDALVAAEAAYFDEGTIPALRKFLSVITGAAVDSKEVEAELAGLYVDLTEKEVGVPLDQNQRALRDNARTRLLLARDKREKADGSKTTEPGNGADEVQYEQAARYIDNLITTKAQNGTSLADEYPMLMTLANDFDGLTAPEVLARAIRQEAMAGTLDPKLDEVSMIRAVAPKIEAHYDAVAKRIEAARAKKNPKPDTSKPSVKPKVAAAGSTEQRQSHGARTLTNATASKAPAKPPKTTDKATEKNAPKTRKDFPNDAAFRKYLLEKNFPS